MNAFVYMLRCADGSYYVGSARGPSLDRRISEHEDGRIRGYTSKRRPVILVYAEHFDRITDAIEAERRLKGWSRAKKEALIRDDWADIQRLAKRPTARYPSTGNEGIEKRTPVEQDAGALLRGPIGDR